MLISSLAARHQPWLVALPAGLLGLLVARWVALGGGAVPLGLLGVLAIGGLGLMLAVGARVVFLGWLLLAPLLQNAADSQAIGYDLRWALYFGPCVVLVVMTFLQPARRPVRWFDPLPLAYGAYVFGSLILTSDLLSTDTVGTAKAFFQIVVIGIVVYYFLAFGPGASIPYRSIAAVLMLGALLQSLLTIVEWRTSWNLWDDPSWRDVAVPRPISTLANPAILGMFIGVGVVVALAVLAWRGPRSLRLLSIVMLAVGVPALVLTLTRGPVLATAVASVAVLVTSRSGRIVGICVITVSVIVVVAVWPSIRQSEVYRDRISNEGNVQARILLQDWSLHLAAEKPLTGWGYGSFDRVKNESDFGTGGLPPRYVLDATSHNTYLTVLVEYGGIGMLLLVLPWATITLLALREVRDVPEHAWAIVGATASIVVIAITASTADFRFFSLAQALPFLFAGMLRRSIR